MAHLQKVIIANQNRGRGTPEDPRRNITQFWSTDGELLGEVDRYAPQYDIAKGVFIGAHIPEQLEATIRILAGRIRAFAMDLEKDSHRAEMSGDLHDTADKLMECLAK